ncbi:MAG: murein biosynthesis integral membrane protein MurJ [Anaerolineales bacterium]|nr:murein biosynthesis integral membrane protein MurJ [Anaerolineae bacterium]PWB49540.1 MAG: murein biosynthesis integral membrane protein MurJ [Anaerolineales bacterium]
MSRFAKSTLIVAVFFGLEKLLGLLHHVLVARQFGLSPALDAFNAANNLPDLLFALISGGALGIALIPVMTETLHKEDRQAAWDLFSRIANLVFLVTAAIAFVLAIFAVPLVQHVVTPGFTIEQQRLVVSIMRLDLLATILFSLAGLVIAGLQSNQHFVLPAIAPSMYDLGMLFGVIILAPEAGYHLGPITLPAFGMGIYGVVYGTIVGAVLFLVIQLPGLLMYKFHWIPSINLHHPAVRKVLNLMGPRVLTVFFIQMLFVARDRIASGLSIGSVTALSYGWLFMQVPETLVGTAIGTVLLPTISEQVAHENMDSFRQSLNRAMRIILALTIPGTALVAVGIRPIVSILGFDAAGTDLVVWVTRAFLVGLMGQSLVEVAARAFYAQQNALVPLGASFLTTLIFVSFGVVFSSMLGAAGIALATGLAFTAEAIFLWWLLSRRFPGVVDVRSTLVRVIPVSIVTGLLVYGLLQLSLPISGIIFAVLAMGLGGLLVLPFVLPELRSLVNM